MELIKLENINFEINGQKILDNINFTIDKNVHTSISGPSGSGKSTVLRLIARLNDKTSGNVLYKGKNVLDYKYTEYRKMVSYVMQNPQLFGETVYDNLAFPAEIREEEFNESKAKEILDRLGLSYLDFNKDIGSLSGGERQRVGLCRNLIYPPEVLLLDEITSSLDDESSKNIWNFLFNYAKENDITMIWISHDDEEQKMAEKQILLEKGRVVKGGENE